MISTEIARKLGAIPEQIRRKSRTNSAKIAREFSALKIACSSNRYRFVLFFARLALSLPQVVTFSDGSTITYTYTHDGKKLRTVHVIGSVTTTTDYCGNVIYENGTAKRLLNDEGYFDLTTNTYYYYLKDHQGNNRVVIDKSGTVHETNHYYPFGGLFATSTNVQPYKYNGKELDTKKGLNLYDYGARHYDAALGRWHVVDPMAEKMGAWSPYGYCYNNPMKFVDEEGESPLKVLKAAFNVGKRMYKTYKRSGKLNLKQALKDEGLNIVDNVKTLFDDNASTSEQIFAGIDLITGFGGEIKDASKSLGIIDDAVDTSKNTNKASKARFIGDVDGKVIDTKMTPKGTYVQPNGSETDVLGREHKNKIGSGKTISVGTSHTHNKGKNVAPNGKVYEYREDKAHIPTYDEIINIIDGNAKRK